MESPDFIIKPRQLTITWGDDDRYWEWIDGETPRLLSVYWFKIRGRFAMSRLTHGVKYQLTFEVELESWAKGWESPVTLKMVFPHGRSTTRVETLDHHPREQLLMLCVGEFEASGNGEIEFEMAETNDQKEKKGVVIRRVVIQPSSTTTPQERSALPRNPAPQSNPSDSPQGDHFSMYANTRDDGGGGWGFCNDCGEMGHTSDECPMKGLSKIERYANTRDDGGGGWGFCNDCGETEHTSDECPMKGLSKIEDVIIQPRQLSIKWGENKRNWHWIDGVTPRLLKVSWLEIRGGFEMSYLMRDAKYQLVFAVELESSAKGWESPVTLKLVLPDGHSTTRVETLDGQPRDQLLMLRVGEFVVAGSGEIKFEMTETVKLNKKKGLVIRRVVIQHSQDLIIKPRQLTITWGDDDRYWEWIDGETPRLLSVYCFKIEGRFAMSCLTHGAKYQLTFEVELESWAKGWESPVTLNMVFPDGRSTTRVETLDHHPREQLLMLCVGEFEASGNGEIKFEMAETNVEKEKKGLVIRRVVIQPSSTNTPQERSALPSNSAPQSNPSASSCFGSFINHITKDFFSC